MTLPEIFAKNMRKYRIESGITQEELGLLAGLHRTYIGAVERGERNISLKNVEKISKALRVAPVDLMKDENGN